MKKTVAKLSRCLVVLSMLVTPTVSLAESISEEISNLTEVVPEDNVAETEDSEETESSEIETEETTPSELSPEETETEGLEEQEEKPVVPPTEPSEPVEPTEPTESKPAPATPTPDKPKPVENVEITVNVPSTPTAENAQPIEPAIAPLESSIGQAGTRFDDTESFVSAFGEWAREIAQENDLYASVLIAQAILESGSGSSSLANAPNYNLFGIKGNYQGQSVLMPTMEDNGKGLLFAINDSFRVYPSYKESLEDYADLLTGGIANQSTFYQGTWKSKTKSYQEATQFLQGRYATDTSYAKKLNDLIVTYDLTEYDKPATTDFSKPLKQLTVTSEYGATESRPSEHKGVDFAGNYGEPIKAILEGVVEVAAFEPGYGYHVFIRHENGFESRYAHQSQLAVKVGEKVAKGQIIGYVGSTGDSTGNHLHLEILKNNKQINPLQFFDERGDNK